MSNQTKAIIKRFIKAFIGGAAGQMVLIPFITTASWEDLRTWLGALILMGVAGGISGVVLAIQKWYSWKDNEPVL